MSIRSRGREAASIFRRFFAIAGGFWSCETKWTVRLMTVSLAALTVGQVFVPVAINLWSQRLFDALEQRSTDRLATLVLVAGGILLFNIAVMVGHLRVKRKLQLGWRRWLTRRVVEGWLVGGRQHLISLMPGDHDNPDGRIAEDVRVATEYAIDLALSLSYCLLLLVGFTSILWSISGSPEVTLFGVTVRVHGWLLYVALAYAAAGTTIALLVGQPLVHAANRRQGYEADFRFALARVRERAQPIALLHGEVQERRRLEGLFHGVKLGWKRQTRALSDMMAFSSAYSVLSVAFPILVAAPRYISGAISLGVLMQTAQAFQQTVAALSWPIDNLARAAEWRASVERVLGLHDALRLLDHELAGNRSERLVVERVENAPSIRFEGVTLAEPNGHVTIEPFDLEIPHRERLLIAGDPGAAVRLFKAVAGVWPWGRGRIVLPARSRVFFMPERPYLPSGPLRGVLSYPVAAESVEDWQAREVLEQVGLDHLVPMIDAVERWNETLPMSEQQRLGFARLLVRRPDWIFLEGAASTLDPRGEEDMLHLLDAEFPDSTLIFVGHPGGLAVHHQRALLLERTNGSVRLRVADAEPAVVADTTIPDPTLPNRELTPS